MDESLPHGNPKSETYERSRGQFRINSMLAAKNNSDSGYTSGYNSGSGIGDYHNANIASILRKMRASSSGSDTSGASSASSVDSVGGEDFVTDASAAIDIPQAKHNNCENVAKVKSHPPITEHAERPLLSSPVLLIRPALLGKGRSPATVFRVDATDCSTRPHTHTYYELLRLKTQWLQSWKVAMLQRADVTTELISLALEALESGTREATAWTRATVLECLNSIDGALNWTAAATVQEETIDEFIARIRQLRREAGKDDSCTLRYLTHSYDKILRQQIQWLQALKAAMLQRAVATSQSISLALEVLKSRAKGASAWTRATVSKCHHSVNGVLRREATAQDESIDEFIVRNRQLRREPGKYNLYTQPTYTSSTIIDWGEFAPTFGNVKLPGSERMEEECLILNPAPPWGPRAQDTDAYAYDRYRGFDYFFGHMQGRIKGQQGS